MTEEDQLTVLVAQYSVVCRGTTPQLYVTLVHSVCGVVYQHWYSTVPEIIELHRLLSTSDPPELNATQCTLYPEIQYFLILRNL